MNVTASVAVHVAIARHVLAATAVVAMIISASWLFPAGSSAQTSAADTELWITHTGSALRSVAFDTEHAWLHSDGAQAELHAYRLDTGAHDAARSFEIGSAGRTRGIWTDGSTVWVVAADREVDDTLRADPGLVAFSLVTGTRLENRDECISGHKHPVAPPNRPVPTGIASDGSTFWVALEGSRTLYAHRLRDGLALPARNLTLPDSHGAPSGLFVRRGTLWAVSPDDATAFAYSLATGSATPDLDLDLARSHQGLTLRPVGMWSDGRRIAISFENGTDSTGDRVLIEPAPEQLSGSPTGPSRPTGSIAPGGGGGGGGGGGRDDNDSMATVVVANGWSAPDIGVAAALSARTEQSAVLYTSGDRLSVAARDVLSEHRPMSVVIVGGEAAISGTVQNAIKRVSRDDAVTRVTGATRVVTAVGVARSILGEPAARTTRPTLIIANGWSPPDIGAAAALSARTADSAVLYTGPGTLDSDTAAALRDYRPARIVIIGGTAAVSNAVQAAISAAAPEAALERFAGATRVATAAAVARRALSDSVAGSDTFTPIIANGWSPPDIGAAAAPAARTPNSAVLYTTPNALPDDITQLIRDYQTGRIYIVGGTAAITSDVTAAIRRHAPDALISRTEGITRTHTAATIARRILGPS